MEYSLNLDHIKKFVQINQNNPNKAKILGEFLVAQMYAILESLEKIEPWVEGEMKVADYIKNTIKRKQAQQKKFDIEDNYAGIKYLVKSGADLNLFLNFNLYPMFSNKDNSNPAYLSSSPLLLAYLNESSKTVNLFLKNGANINIQNKISKNSVIHYAAAFGDIDFLEKAILIGGDFYAYNDKNTVYPNQTPIDIINEINLDSGDISICNRYEELLNLCDCNNDKSSEA